MAVAEGGSIWYNFNTMDIGLVILAVILLVGFTGVFVYLGQLKKPADNGEGVIKINEVLSQQLSQVRQELNQVLGQQRQEMQRHLGQNTKTVQSNLAEMTMRLDNAAKFFGRFDEAMGNMKALQEFLKSPKVRGEFGERVLEDMLRQVFPDEYLSFQHEFKNNEKVDAVVKMDAGLLPIDAKFPFENFLRLSQAETESELDEARKAFNRDVKKHLDAIAKKYILPAEGTVDFALMYVPSEPVYYEIIREQDLMDYAQVRKVMPVSPSSLFHYLRTIMLGFQQIKMAENINEVRRILSGLGQDMTHFTDDLDLLQKHLKNAQGALDMVRKDEGKVIGKLQQVKLLGTGEATLSGVEEPVVIAEVVDTDEIIW